MPTNRMDKQSVLYLYNGILNNKKRINFNTLNKMNDFQKYVC